MEEDGTRRPLGAGDVNALQFIATQTAVDFALYGPPCSTAPPSSILLKSHTGVQLTLSTIAIAILA